MYSTYINIAIILFILLVFKSKPFKTISSIMGDIDLIRKPDGSKKHPALTCKDLYKNYPELQSGTYKYLIFLCLSWLY